MTIPPSLEPEEGEEEIAYAGIHHTIPLKHGDPKMALFIPPVLPVVDAKAARQPISPGMPPLRHIPLPPPETYRPITLPLEDNRPTDQHSH